MTELSHAQRVRLELAKTLISAAPNQMTARPAELPALVAAWSEFVLRDNVAKTSTDVVEEDNAKGAAKKKAALKTDKADVPPDFMGD